MVPMFSAAVLFTPTGIIAWLVIGLVAGWLAGVVMKGGGYGMVGDIIVGLIGSMLGGFLMSAVLPGEYNLIGSIFVSFIGACALIFILRMISGRRAPV